MKTIKTIQTMREVADDCYYHGQTIGFVPTMGYLHDGHLALVQEAREQNDIVVVSVFVNPLQFNQSADLNHYPRDFERDESLLKAEAVDYIFYPNVEEMYPKELSTQLTLAKRGDVLCGATRPGHFEGVLVVLTKLFNIISPHRVYFGLKDAQQVAVVDGLIEDFNFSTELVPVPTTRESDGLALSSRNVRLTENERLEAPMIYQALQAGQSLIKNNQDWKRDDVLRLVNDELQAIQGTIDYIDCLTYPGLSSDILVEHDIIIAVAVQYQDARLIDNVILRPDGKFKYGGEMNATNHAK
ncbi:pantoate--beta-alanine ligase [Alkalibacillus sp. S2W]|uniref:pantoate--beta-alanine ligase n=1 Tax=Alkalibacillus sp. S2W TaxID=3386553 RepID=UPI00398C8C06